MGMTLASGRVKTIELSLKSHIAVSLQVTKTTSYNYCLFIIIINLIANTSKNLQELTDRVNSSSKRMGLIINVEKTKTMTIGKQREEMKIKIGDTTLEQVTKFVYLGGVITEDGNCTEDIKRRCGSACAALRT